MSVSSNPRQLHVVYCLTSSGGDLYEAMTRVSLATLRLTNPSARVTIACDQQSHQALQASGSQLFHEADAVRGFPTPDGPPTYRNRYVKTQLGRLIDGPFLFLDSDTVVRKPLTPLLDLHCDIAAAPNHSRDTLAEQIWSEDQENLDAMGWQVRDPYVNGGVIWYGGSEGSDRFADAWHCHWLANVKLTERYRDQPALNYALLTTAAALEILEHLWNAQIHGSPKEARDASIWHLSPEWDKEKIFLFSQILLQDQSFSSISPRVSAEALLRSRYPWRSDTWLHRIATNVIISNNALCFESRRLLAVPSLPLSSKADFKALTSLLLSQIVEVVRLTKTLMTLSTTSIVSRLKRVLGARLSKARILLEILLRHRSSGISIAYLRYLELPLIIHPIGMITNYERAFLCWYSAKMYMGVGLIVELGSFVGASTVSLAQGLSTAQALNSSLSAKRIRVYDRYTCGGFEAQYLNSCTSSSHYRTGSSFFPLFLEQTSSYDRLLEVFSGDLMMKSHDRSPIEFLFVDSMKDFELASHIASEFFPSLTANSAWLLHQDFVHYYTSWIHILMYRLRDCFEFLYHIPGSASAVFRVIKSPKRIPSVSELTQSNVSEISDAFAYSRGLIHGPMQENIFAAEIMHYIHLGMLPHARKLFNTWSSRRSRPRFEMSIVESLLANC